MSDTLTQDAFLGGRMALWQPRNGYRAGVDPILLAASVPALPGQRVLDLGCGAGAAILALGRRVEGLDLTGVELQEQYVALAARNAEDNAIPLRVVTADLSRLPAELRQEQFDHVIANPPYYRDAAHTAARDAGRATALGGATALDLWVDAAARRLKPKGIFSLIQRVERLPELLTACTGRLGSIEVLPIAAREGRAPGLILLRAKKGGRADFRLHAPMILHAGAAHTGDGDDYLPEIRAVLRDAAALRWPE